jgi:hypothetical protein
MNGCAALAAEAGHCRCSSNARQKDASKRKRTRQSDAQRQPQKASATYDWALDFEPLALPPDLPPVILVELVGGLVGVGEVVALERELVVRYVGVESRDDGLLAAVGGRGGLIKTGRRVVVRARSTWATSAVARRGGRLIHAESHSPRLASHPPPLPPATPAPGPSRAC